MVAHLGDEKDDKAGDNSGNSRNGSYGKKIQTLQGEASIDWQSRRCQGSI